MTIEELSKLNDVEVKLIKEARAIRDEIINNKKPCCYNCCWSFLGPASPGEKEMSRKYNVYYTHCTWPRLNALPDSVASIRRYERPSDDPLVNLMDGQTCRTFQPK